MEHTQCYACTCAKVIIVQAATDYHNDEAECKEETKRNFGGSNLDAPKFSNNNIEAHDNQDADNADRHDDNLYQSVRQNSMTMLRLNWYQQAQ